MMADFMRWSRYIFGGKPFAWASLWTTLALACPLILGNMINHAVHIVDASMIGQVGVLPLAGAAFASSFFGIFMFFCFGFSVAVTVLVAEAHGRNQHDQKMTILRNALIVSGYGALALTVLMVGSAELAPFFGQPENVIAISKPYLWWLAASIFPMMWMNVLRAFCEATGRPWAPLLFGIVTFLSNLLLNYIFIFGFWFVPGMGLTGAGVATFLARVISLGMIAVYVRKKYRFRWGDASWWRPDALIGWLYTKIALPTGLQITFEAGLFNVATILAGWIGAASMAAHLIALNMAGLAFMIPLGVSFALSIRVSQSKGEQNAVEGMQVIRTTLWFTFALMFVSGLVIFFGKETIPYWFVKAEDVQAPEVIFLATQIFWIVTFFQLSDGMNIVANGGLRGLQDVRIPTGIVFVLYWMISLPCAIWLGFEKESGLFAGWGLGLGIQGIWYGLAGGVTLCAIALTWRLWHLGKKVFPVEG